MFVSRAIAEADKTEFYRELAQQAQGLFAGERDPIANAANLAALLFHTLPDLNWAGFYFLRDPGVLVLGPFQGQPACVRIALSRGVCGTAAAQGETICVADVHAFPGHIACDAASRSELVVPLIVKRVVKGVLDLDSPSLSRFDASDQAGVERIAAIYVEASDL
jgi:GAF domain-containing protein